MLKAPSGVGWQFGKFRLMPDKRLLLSDGIPVPLMAKAFDTLVLLVDNRDRVVSKDELLGAVWPDVVVEEGNLTQQIFLLRKALGESAQHPHHIVTVPGRGYRFTTPVTEIAPDADSSERHAVETVDGPPLPPAWNRRRVIVAIVLAGAVAGLGMVFAFDWSPPPAHRSWLDPAAVRIQKLTETGRVSHVAISPDGRYIAYAEAQGDQYSLHVQQIATGGKTEVVKPQPQMLTYLRFSPDGEFLYFVRGLLGRGAFVLSRVPTIGGLETPVLDDVDTPISFSPDGRQFAFMRGALPKTHIVIAETGGGGQRILDTRTSPRGFLFVAPAWSPDGKWVAAAAADASDSGRSSILLLPVAGGDRRELYSTDYRIGALRWMPDGAGLLTILSETVVRQFAPWQGQFARVSGGSVWRIPYPRGEAERLTSDLADYDPCCLDVAASGRTIAAILNALVSDLWIAAAESLDTPRQITWSNPVVARHAWLPDNDTIIYRDLGGHLNGVHKDGRGFRLAVPDGRKVAGAVSACGDGRYIVFQAFPGNSIWRVTPTAGGATPLTTGHLDWNPACTPDGRWVLYTSNRSGVASLWRVPIEGGEPAPVMPDETVDALPSPGGRFLYYATYEWNEHPTRVRVLRWIVATLDGGEQRFAFDAPADKAVGTTAAWAPDESGLDYIVTRNGISNIWRQPLAGGPPVQVTRLNALTIFSFAWSRDGKWLSLASGINRSDVVVISGTQ